MFPKVLLCDKTLLGETGEVMKGKEATRFSQGSKINHHSAHCTWLSAAWKWVGNGWFIHPSRSTIPFQRNSLPYYGLYWSLHMPRNYWWETVGGMKSAGQNGPFPLHSMHFSLFNSQVCFVTFQNARCSDTWVISDIHKTFPLLHRRVLMRRCQIGPLPYLCQSSTVTVPSLSSSTSLDLCTSNVFNRSWEKSKIKPPTMLKISFVF